MVEAEKALRFKSTQATYFLYGDKMKIFRSLAAAACATLFSSAFAADPNQALIPGLRSAEKLTIISANDGQSHLKLKPEAYSTNVPLQFERGTNVTRDSITVVTLSPDAPPKTKTVYGTVPSTILGSPYIATSHEGRYAFITCHTSGVLGPENGDLISVIDISSSELKVVQKIHIDTPSLAVMHPNGRHLVVGYAQGFKVFELKEGTLTEISDHRIGTIPESFDINRSGDRIVAAQNGLPRTSEESSVHLYEIRNGTIKHLQRVEVGASGSRFDLPFSIRFSPDGKRALIPNGGGGCSKGRLDDLLILDMAANPPVVKEVLRDVADGIESVAFHPSGRFAVVGCLDDCPGDAYAGFSHIAIVDLTSTPARILYHLPVDAYPEGLEFSPDGSQLFVQLTAANRIAVFNVDGFALTQSPFVIRVGHAPSLMGLTRAYRP